MDSLPGYKRFLQPGTNRIADAPKAWATDNTHRTTVTLPDGTVVQLNAGSRLEITEATFNRQKREVWLSGEAFFEVAKNPEKPFIIHTGTMQTTVRGTSFNVKAYGELGENVVSVRNGRVEIVENRKTIADEYIYQVEKVNQLNANLDEAVAAPSLENRPEKISEIQSQLIAEKVYLTGLSHLVEAVVQSQTERTLAEMGFSWGGQVFPPVLYKVSDLPLDLIVSPRTEIRTALSLNLNPGLDTLQKEAIEQGIYTEYNYSALVEPIGGLSAYPTMVMQTTDFNWLVETVAHEWMHNYLFFHP